MGHVFISYAQQDRERVKPFAEALKEAGVEVWWDIDVPPGSTFREEIQKALNAASAVIVIWSKHSVASHFVLDEASRARDRGILFPALIDRVDMPLGFGQVQTVNLTNWSGKKSDKAFQSLIQAVASFIKQKQERGAADPTLPLPSTDDPDDLLNKKYATTGKRLRGGFFLKSAIVSLVLGALFSAAVYPLFAEGTYDILSEFIGPMALIFVLPFFLGRYFIFLGDLVKGAASTRTISKSYFISFLAFLIPSLIIAWTMIYGPSGDASFYDGVLEAFFIFLFLAFIFAVIAVAVFSALRLIWLLVLRYIFKKFKA